MVEGEGEGEGWYLDGEVVFDFVQRAGGGEAADGIHGEFFLLAHDDAFAVARVFAREDQSQAGEVARFRHLDADLLALFGDLFGLATGLVAFGVEDDFFVDADADALDGHLARFTQPVQVRAQFDVYGDGVERAVAPSWETDCEGDEVVGYPFCGLLSVVHAERAERVVACDGDGEGKLLLLLMSLLHRHDQLVHGLCDPRR